jgi:membrane-associated phospholipid phosphatase
MNTVRAIQSFFGPGVHPLFLAITFLGTSGVLWGLLFLYHWLVDPRFGRRLAIVFAASILANRILKNAFGTNRPYISDATLATGSAQRTGGGHGFPSGHTMNAATVYFAFAFRYRRPLLWLAAVVLVIAVGLSRLYLGVHLPVDVGGGLILGALFAWDAGAWTHPLEWPRRRLWVPVVGLAGLGACYLGNLGIDALSCGLLVGSLIAQDDFEPPRDARGRVVIVAGGLVLLGLLAGLLLWLPERLQPGLLSTVPVSYLAGLVLAWVGLDVWPRLFLRLFGGVGIVRK